jgi:acyl phosphate:glycerol-3-phosphate acyltransferase
MWRYLVAGVGAYLLGSLTPGVFWGWVMRHIDVRLHGSGRTGGTNVWRTAGFPAALLTALSDMVKGAAAVWLAGKLGLPAWAMAAAGALAVVGHNYSFLLGFHGGAGTAVSVGVAAMLWTTTLPVLVVAGIAVGLLVGHASVASILIALLLPMVFLIRGDTAYAIAFGIPAMALTIWALRPNIERLLKGEERYLPIFHDKPPLIRLSHHPSKSR